MRNRILLFIGFTVAVFAGELSGGNVTPARLPGFLLVAIGVGGIAAIVMNHRIQRGRTQ